MQGACDFGDLYNIVDHRTIFFDQGYLCLSVVLDAVPSCTCEVLAFWGLLDLNG